MAAAATTTGAPDQQAVDAYIESCVAFESNVAFVLPSSAVAATNVLFLSQAGDDAATALFASSVAAAFGSHIDAPAATIAQELIKRTDGVNSVLPGAAPTSKVSLRVARISTKASRHNCPWRADLIIDAVKAAALEAGATGTLAIWVSPALAAQPLGVAQTVAKAAGRSFSAKGGRSTKAHSNDVPTVRVVMPAGTTEQTLRAMGILAQSVQLCMRLVDAPTNLLYTLSFATIARRITANVPGCSYSDIVGEELRQKGYGGIYNVGKAAEFPPALVALSYTPATPSPAAKKVAFVGKGIVYDTGGLAIKTPATGMCTMKCDMGGAAAVFCGFLALARLGVATPIDCVLCLADNAIGPRSFRNDDIIILRSGLSIEINNTDAEGRLVLSDGVYHAAKLMGAEPEVVLDMATLTGAQGIATGQTHAALMTTTEEWEDRALAAGKASGDVLFPILYCPELLNAEFSSKVADHRNSVRSRSNAQSSCAGQFIANSLAEYKGAFVHVDLAGPAFQAEVATGYGVALLLQLFGADRF